METADRIGCRIDGTEVSGVRNFRIGCRIVGPEVSGVRNLTPDMHSEPEPCLVGLNALAPSSAGDLLLPSDAPLVVVVAAAIEGPAK